MCFASIIFSDDLKETKNGALLRRTTYISQVFRGQTLHLRTKLRTCMLMDSATKASRKPEARSRVTNGSKLHPNIDGRSVWARRLRDLIEIYSDGVRNLSGSKQSLIRRAATLTIELERTEAEFAEGDKADAAALSSYQTTSNSLRRLLEAVDIRVGHEKRPIFSEPTDTRQMARAVVQVLSEAVPDGASVAVAAPGEHVARFKDPDLGKKVMPDDTTDDATSPASSPAPEAASNGASGATHSDEENQ